MHLITHYNKMVIKWAMNFGPDSFLIEVVFCVIWQKAILKCMRIAELGVTLICMILDYIYTNTRNMLGGTVHSLKLFTLAVNKIAAYTCSIIKL